MTTAILKSNNRASIELLIDVAKKMGIKGYIPTYEEMEDVILGKLIDEGMNDGEEDVPEVIAKKKLKRHGIKV